MKKVTFEHVKYSPVLDGDEDDATTGLDFSQSHEDQCEITDDENAKLVNGDLEVGVSVDNGLEKARILGHEDSATVRVVKSRLRNRGVRVCCVVTLLTLCILLGTALCVFILPWLTSSSVVTHETHKSTPDWTKDLPGYSSESCIRVLDMDGDGGDDVLIGVVNATLLMELVERGDMSYQTVQKYCESQGAPPLCLGSLLAMRGTDGHLLWQMSVHGGVFELNCGNIDVDKDGRPDCLAAGRFASLLAFDPRKGTVFWRGNHSYFHSSWNIYNPLVVPDLNGDGVKDIVVAHGGDPKYPAQVHVRSPGSLLLLSGSTGAALGDSVRPLTITDDRGDRETYMSPVLHHTEDGSMYVLFGSGGETVPGSLCAISLPDLYTHSTGRKLTIKGKGQYKDWAHLPRDERNVMEIYRSSSKGVMVPPVLVEMTEDGVKDLLMMAYDGTVALYDGQTLHVIWSRRFDNYESYSTPAPGHFNDDTTLDFILHLNLGEWPQYKYCLTVILDGVDGTVLWSLNTSKYEMSSDVVLSTKERNRDVFITRIQGEISPLTDIHSTRLRRHVVPQQKQYPPPADVLRGDNRPKTKWPSSVPPQAIPGGQNAKSYMNLGENMDDIPYNDYSDYIPNYFSDDQLYPSYQDDPSGLTYNQAPADDFSHMSNTQQEQGEDGGLYLDPNFECNHEAGGAMTRVLMIDRSVLDTPLVIDTFQPEKIYYNISSNEKRTPARRHASSHPDAAKHPHYLSHPFTGQLCMLRTSSERATGAVGDLDGDGDLDLVTLYDLSAHEHDERGVTVKRYHSVRMSRVNLRKVVTTATTVHANVNKKLSGVMGISPNLRALPFLPMSDQPWTAYLGTRADSVYHHSSEHLL